MTPASTRDPWREPDDETNPRWVEVVERAPDAMLLTVTDGRIFAANRAATEILGYTREEIFALGRGGLLVPDDAARRLVEERRRTGSARGLVSMRRQGGDPFLADVTSTIFRGSGDDALATVIIRDVTESQRAVHALEILASAGRVLAGSLDLEQTFVRLTALVVPRLADVCAVDLVRPDGIKRVAIAHRDPARAAAFGRVRRRSAVPDATAGVDFVLRTGEPSCVFRLEEEWLKSATHDRAHFEAARELGVRSFVSVPLAVGGVTFGAMTVMSDGGVPPFGPRDLSLVRALGDLAASAIDSAQRHAEVVEARRLRDEVLGVVAHDLRNPLNVVNLTASVLARSSSCGEEARAAAAQIKAAVRRADILIEDLLLASKSEGGILPLHRQREDLGAIVREVAASHRPLADVKSLELVVRADATADAADVDRNRVLQLLGNLVANAIKFTDRGRIEIGARGDAEHVIVTVSDTGPGIAAEDLPRVFDRYWQAAHSRDLGAGLGLSIARGVARAHGGDIGVTSEVGRGATFTVTLPRR